jgi:S1-C subfamily serine protease
MRTAGALHAAVGAWQRHVASTLVAASLALGAGPSVVPAAIPIDRGTTLSALKAQEQTVEDLFERATPSVVYITTFVERAAPFSMDAIQTPAGTGSGFVWDDAGDVVTNYHVIRGAQAAKVVVTDAHGGKQRRYDARLVGYNPDKDVAVLRIDAGATRPPPIAIGSSASLRVGQTALAIGNP